MLYASLKAVHLLAVIAWLGGMFFVLMCLRPAAHEVLEAPPRVRLMHATLRRFLRIVGLAVLAILLSGAAMEAERWPDAGAALVAIRWEVAINLVLGIFVVVLVRLGTAV